MKKYYYIGATASDVLGYNKKPGFILDSISETEAGAEAAASFLCGLGDYEVFKVEIKKICPTKKTRIKKLKKIITDALEKEAKKERKKFNNKKVIKDLKAIGYSIERKAKGNE